jgi:putative iron-regulated protein
MKRFTILSVVLAGVVLMNCKDDNDSVAAVDSGENSVLLTDFSTDVAASVYVNLSASTTELNANVASFVESKSDADLAKVQASWKKARETWEQSEAHLFGPVATDEIDPRIDTWPVNFTDLDAQLSSDHEFTSDYIDGLDNALKGFHPIEYLIFGKEGDKKGADFTDRQFEYLTALAQNLQDLTIELAFKWTPTTSGNYLNEVIKAGNGSTAYATQRAAFEEIVTAMAGICDEVANAKLAEPYDAKDPLLEESPFAGNSIIDFTNNIKGVRNVYTGKFQVDGHGLDELVKKHNLSLDAEINARLDAAITSLGNITVPFGDAIFDQSVQIENAMTAINDLKTTLEEKLFPFVQQHSN